MTWNFRTGGKTENPKDTGIKDFSRYIFESVVREATQNSIDNRKDKGNPVVVNFEFGKIDSNEIPGYGELVARWGCVYDKWKSQDQYESLIQEVICRINSFEGMVPYLSISDFNTKGMDFTSNEDIDKTRYGAFSRGTHSFHDSDGAAGSEGQGKAALYAVSAMRTIFVHTISAKGSIYEGLTRFATHDYKGVRYNADGYYPYSPDSPEYENGRVNHDLPFRRNTNETGTTITMIGLIDFQEAEKNMVRAALNNFWMAILDNDLIIQIGGYEISKETFFELQEEFLPERTESNRTKSDPTKYGRTKCYVETWLGDTEGKWAYERELKGLGKCELKISKNVEYPGKILFFRGQKMLIYRSSAGQFINKGFCGVFYCGDELGNKVLRKMESKTHTEWDPKYCSTQNDREEGKSAIKQINEFIKDSWAHYYKRYMKDSFDMPFLDGVGQAVGNTRVSVCKRCGRNPCVCPGKPKSLCSVCQQSPCVCERSEHPKPEIKSVKDESGWKYILRFNYSGVPMQCSINLSLATDSVRSTKSDVPKICEISDGWIITDNMVSGHLVGGDNFIEIRLDSPERVGFGLKIELHEDDNEIPL